jgi:hypothetical protein
VGVVDTKSLFGEVESFQRNNEGVVHECALYVNGPSVLLSRDDVAIGLARPRASTARPR